MKKIHIIDKYYITFTETLNTVKCYTFFNNKKELSGNKIIKMDISKNVCKILKIQYELNGLQNET